MAKTIMQNARFDWQGDTFEYARVALSFEANGARYHQWLNRNTGKPEDGKGTWLYKNPPQVTQGMQYGRYRHTAEFFETRKLDSEAKGNAELIARAREAAECDAESFLHSRALFKRHCEEVTAQRDAEHKAAQAAERVKEHGPALLAALKVALCVMNDTARDSIYDPAKSMARDAIAAAESKESSNATVF